jgi:hypothetical protein
LLKNLYAFLYLAGLKLTINPSEASAKISYASAFGPDFCLLLRERRATSLAQMKDASIEVEYNVLAADRLRKKADTERRKGRSEPQLLAPRCLTLKWMN